MDNIGLIRSELDQAAGILNDFLNDADNLEKVEKAAEIISSSIKNGGKVISCGNGGSHCDAMHFAEEMAGRFRDDRKPLPAISISEPGYITCTANDYGFDHIFSRAVEGLGRKGDTLLAISTSGNSPNVINALNVAKKKEMRIIVLTGEDGGKLSGQADVEINIPFRGYADRIQEMHIKIIHILILLIENQVS